MAYVRMNPTRIWESLQPKLWTWPNGRGSGRGRSPLCLLQVVKNGMITKPTAKHIPIPEPTDSFSGPSKSSWPAQSLQRPWPGIKPGQLSGTASPVAVAARCPKHSKRPLRPWRSKAYARSQTTLRRGSTFRGPRPLLSGSRSRWRLPRQIIFCPLSNPHFWFGFSIGRIYGKTWENLFWNPQYTCYFYWFSHVFPWFPCRLFDDVRFQAIDRDDDREVTWEEPLDRHWATGQLDASGKPLENIQNYAKPPFFDG